MSSLQNESGRTGSGMVRILPVFPQYLGDSVDGLDILAGLEDDSVNGNEETVPEANGKSQMPAFSGVFTTNQVRDVFETEMEHTNCSDRDEASTIYEESESISVGEVIRSPVFSEDESSDNAYWIDLGQSPVGSDSGRATKQKKGSPMLPSWFSSKKTNKRHSPKLTSKVSRSPIHDGSRTNSRLQEDSVLSFDSALLSMSQEQPDCAKMIPEEEQFTETECKIAGEIQEEVENGSKLSSISNGFSSKNLNSTIVSEAGQENKDNAIRRETEGDFRLLGRRERGRFFGLDEGDRVASMGHRTSFSMEESHREYPTYSEPGEVSLTTTLCGDDSMSDGGDDDEQEWQRREPEINCRYLDHVNLLGLNKTTLRLRYLINWLVTSLLQLQHPSSTGTAGGVPLVQIYGPKIKYERGGAVAFNLRQDSAQLIHPEVVLKLAEKNGISLGIGILNHVKLVESSSKQQHCSDLDLEDNALCQPMANGHHQDRKNVFYRVEAVTASLGFLTNFEDVYRMWAFIARFLNPAFVEGDDELSTVPEGSET